MKSTAIAVSILAVGLGLAACSDSSESQARKEKHTSVFKDQVEAYDTAKDVAGMVNQNLEQEEQRRREIER